MDSFSSAPLPLGSVLTLHSSLLEAESLQSSVKQSEETDSTLLGMLDAETKVAPDRVAPRSFAQRNIIFQSVINQQLSLGPTSGIQIGRMGSRNLKKLSDKLKIKVRAGTGLEELLEEMGGDAALLAEVLAQHDGDENDRKRRQAYSKKLLSKYASQVTCNDLVSGGAREEVNKDVRDFFHRKVANDASARALLVSIIKLVGEGELPAGIKQLQNELNHRLVEQSLSKSQAIYQQQLDLLVINTSVRLANAWRACDDLIALLQITNKPSASNLLQRILEMIDEGLNGDSIKALYINVGGNQGAYRSRMNVFNHLVTLFRRLPLVMWRTESDRQNDMNLMLNVMGMFTDKVQRNVLPIWELDSSRGPVYE